MTESGTGDAEREQVAGALLALGQDISLWFIPGASCSLFSTPKGDTLFEFGFVREAVNKLGCFPSDELPLPNFRMTSRAVMPDSKHTASWVSGTGDRRRGNPDTLTE